MILLEPIVRTLGADAAALMVPTVSERYSYCYESFNMPREWVNIKNSFDEKVIARNVEVYITGKPVIINHMEQSVKGHYLESVLIVPIIKQSNTVAILEIMYTKVDKSFDDDDLLQAVQYSEVLAKTLPERFS